jgi:V/A-type H+-transporting ATPase subunit I
MTEMRKLKVLVLEEHIDAVLRTLAEMGAVQLIDMPKRLESWEGTLLPYDVPTDVADRCSRLLTRISTIFSKIDKIFEITELETSEAPIQSAPISRAQSVEVLSEMERRLLELEKQVSAEEERWAMIITNLQERQTAIDKLRTLTRGLEKNLLDKKHQELEKHIVDSKRILRKELSIATAALEKQIVNLEDVIKEFITEVISETKPVLGEIREDLLAIGEAVHREESVTNVKSQLARTAKTVYFEAYVLSSHLQAVTSRIKEVSDGNCLVGDERPSPDESVPIVPKPVPSYMAAFEKLTLATGYPSITEINPTSIMTITFPLLFGIMFADVGQGIIFAVLGILLVYLRGRVKLEDMGEIFRYVLTSGELFTLLGISAVFFGFLFGEFFGPSGVIHPISLGRIGPFYLGGFEPTHEPLKMLRFSIFVGVIHISLGLIFRVINEVKRRHYRLVPVPICWLWLLLGGFLMWTYWGGISGISRWFAEGILFLGGLVILPLVLIMLFTGLAEGVMEGIGYGVEVIAETLSHTLSYGRLMALGLVHSVMNNLFLVLGGVEHGQFSFSSIPLIAIGTILVMTVEGLIVFVHTLRLHWIEWFSKFYTGEGIPFKPLSQNREKSD